MSKLFKKYSRLPVQIRASLAFFMCSLFQKGISVITAPIFTRIMTADDYGRYGAFYSWYEILIAIISLSMVGGVYTTALVKFSDEKRKLVSSSQGLLLLSCLVWALIYVLFHDWWNRLLSLNTLQVISMLIMILTSSTFGLWAIEQRTEYNYKRLVLVTAIVSVMKPTVGIWAVLRATDKVTARIVSALVVEVLFYSWIIFFNIFRGSCLFSGKFWRYLLVYSLPLIPHSISQSVLHSSDRIMIQNMIGNKEAGFYNLAYSVALMMIIVNSSLSQTLAPWTYQKLKAGRENELNRIAVASCIVIALMNLLLIILAPEMMAIFAPKEYAGAVYAIPPIAMSVYFMFLYDWFVRIEYYFERTHYILVASIGGALVNLALNYFWLPILGYVAAGYTTLISYMFYTFLHYYFMRKICKEQLENKRIYSEKQLAMVTTGFIILGLCLNLTYNSRIVRYLLLFVSLIVAAVFRKQITSFIRELLSIKRADSK